MSPGLVMFWFGASVFDTTALSDRYTRIVAVPDQVTLTVMLLDVLDTSVGSTKLGASGCGGGGGGGGGGGAGGGGGGAGAIPSAVTCAGVTARIAVRVSSFEWSTSIRNSVPTAVLAAVVTR